MGIMDVPGIVPCVDKKLPIEKATIEKAMKGAIIALNKMMVQLDEKTEAAIAEENGRDAVFRRARAKDMKGIKDVDGEDIIILREGSFYGRGIYPYILDLEAAIAEWPGSLWGREVPVDEAAKLANLEGKIMLTIITAAVKAVLEELEQAQKEEAGI